MCNRYIAPSAADLERSFRVGPGNPPPWKPHVFPRAQAPFIRRDRDDSGYARELVVGQWGLVPWFAKAAKLPYSTNNARSEELSAKPTYRDAWKRGQRCIIPALTFDEPNWESGRNVWWSFSSADGEPWALAGLWNTWTDKSTGELNESFTMLTINADDHPLMRRMHKPDPKLPPDRQDKRSVIPLEVADWDQWLAGTGDEARSLLRPAAVEIFIAHPSEERNP